MSQGLLWLPLLLVFVLLTALGWLERRRQNLFREWAQDAELAKLDGCCAARLVNGVLSWSLFQSGRFTCLGEFQIKELELLELMSLDSGDAPLTDESLGTCRLRLVGRGQQQDVPFEDAERARRWMHELMTRSRCEL